MANEGTTTALPRRGINRICRRRCAVTAGLSGGIGGVPIEILYDRIKAAVTDEDAIAQAR